MAEIIILELPEPLAQRVKEVAAFKQQRVRVWCVGTSFEDSC